jgi:hypothetical protein
MQLSKRTKYSVVGAVAALLLIGLGGYGFISWASPTRFTYPKFDHLHFRMQYIFRGEAEDFGSAKYQVDYAKDICDGNLTESPIHFHDNKDQIVHIHWQGMTGGDVLKFYGLNLTGGLDNTMGFQLDKLFSWPPKITHVPYYNDLLPEAQGEDKYYIYTGDANSYNEKSLQDFLYQPLETFFAKESNIRKNLETEAKLRSSRLDSLFTIPVLADHPTHSKEEQIEIDKKKTEKQLQNIETNNNAVSENIQNTSDPKKTEDELKEINNLIGNVVVFVQPNKPTDEQIKARFNNLEPLGLSQCGG